MKIVLPTLFVFLAHCLFGQAQKSFNEADYPLNEFAIKKDRRSLGPVTVDVIQVRPKSEPGPNQFYCRAWLIVHNANKQVEEKYSGDIEPVGGWFGLMFPDRQPNKDFILLSKFGDYDGRIYIVNKNGK